jgi:hypothetical protein
LALTFANKIECAEESCALANREQERIMKCFSRFAFAVFLALIAATLPRAAAAATLDDRVSARLDALEKENAALRARVIRLEASRAAKLEHRPASAESNPSLTSTLRQQNAEALGAGPNVMSGSIARRPVDAEPWKPRPHFEVSGSLLYLQPGAGDLEYGTLITPLPLVTPTWTNQALKPDFSPTFRVGLRYMPTVADDIQLGWTHLNATAYASVFAAPTQMVGPPYLIGPESALYKNGYGTVQSQYDAVNLDAGHTFCTECPFQLRVFGGVEYARIGQNLSGLFQSPDGTASNGYTTNSVFNGAGPRVGLKGQYALGDLQFIGEVAGAGLIGTSQSHIDFTTISPAAGLNTQGLTSPNTTQVIPSIDARLATAYTFPLGGYGQFKIELGYQAAVYFNAVSQYALTNVPTSLTLPPVGIYLATEQHTQSNFTDQGPYVTASWAF